MNYNRSTNLSVRTVDEPVLVGMDSAEPLSVATQVNPDRTGPERDRYDFSEYGITLG